MSISRRGTLHESIGHAFVVALILILPARLVSGEPFWGLPGINTWLVLGFLAACFTTLCPAGGLARCERLLDRAPVIGSSPENTAYTTYPRRTVR